MATKSWSANPSLLPRSTNLRKDGDGNTVRNEILLGLPRKECDAVFSNLTLVNLELHDLLQEAGQEIQFCYFPNTMMASVLNVMADGKSVEVGLAGWEGFVGLPTTGFHNVPMAPVDPVTQAIVEPLVRNAALSLAFNEAWFVLGVLFILSLVLIPFIREPKPASLPDTAR